MKVFLRLLKWTAISLLSLIILVVLFLVLDRDYQSVELTDAERKTINPKKAYNPNMDSSIYNDLLETYGKNKVLAKGFETQCLLALSHYPELKDAPIEFRVEPAFLPLSSRPDPITVLFPFIKRRYLVVISSASADFFEPILLKNTPFNEQVGIIGHELGHTLFYQDKSAIQLVGILYNYEYNDDFQVAFERDTDKRAIAHGLGYQMYDFAFFVRKAFGDTQEEIEQEEGDMYLSPKEIAAEMKKYEFYIDTLNHPNTYF